MGFSSLQIRSVSIQNISGTSLSNLRWFSDWGSKSN